MELRRMDSFLFKTLYLVAAGIVVTQVLGLEDLTSSLFLLTFPLTVFLWIRSVRKTVTTGDLLVILASVAAIVNVLIDASASNADMSFDYIKKPIMFIMSLLFLQTAHRVRIGQDVVRFINRLADFLTVFLIFMYFAQFSQMHILNERVTIYLTFRFSNPNLTALFVICLYMLAMYRLFTPERWYRKLVHIIMALFLAWFVIETYSRNSWLVLFLFTAVCAWLIFRGRRNMRIGKGFAALASVFPALFVGAYMLLIYAEWVQKLLAFLVGEGKDLDSRVKVWGPAVQSLAESPLIGAYNAAAAGFGTGHLHNTHLDIACCYGIPVLIVVCVLLYKYFYQNGRIYSNKSSYIYMLAFICAIMLGIGEAALFSGGLGIYVFIGAFLLLANAAEEKGTGL